MSWMKPNGGPGALVPRESRNGRFVSHNAAGTGADSGDHSGVDGSASTDLPQGTTGKRGECAAEMETGRDVVAGFYGLDG